jgi:hypothetical protein
MDSIHGEWWTCSTGSRLLPCANHALAPLFADAQGKQAKNAEQGCVEPALVGPMLCGNGRHRRLMWSGNRASKREEPSQLRPKVGQAPLAESPHLHCTLTSSEAL